MVFDIPLLDYDLAGASLECESLLPPARPSQHHYTFQGRVQGLIETLLDGYETVHDGTGAFGYREFLCYNEALRKWATVIKAISASSHTQYQSAAKDLTQSPDISPNTHPGDIPSLQSKDQTCKALAQIREFSRAL